MIDADAILQKLGEAARSRLELLEVLPEIDSTNTYLLWQEPPWPGQFRAVLAHHQTAGRGREGKRWVSPPSSGLCLSVACTFENIPQNVSSLTLAIGAGLVSALQALGAEDLSLKWPNDLVARDAKLGGILTEGHGTGRGRSVVIGVGLNVELPEAMRQGVASGWTDKACDLSECMESLPDRARLAAAVIDCLYECVTRFEGEGLVPFRATWQSHDWLRGKRVEAGSGPSRISGIAGGIDRDGALLVDTGEGVQRVMSGSVAVPDNRAACA